MGFSDVFFAKKNATLLQRCSSYGVGIVYRVGSYKKKPWQKQNKTSY